MSRRLFRPVLPVALVAALLVACGGGVSDQDLVASAQSYIDKQNYKAAMIQLKTALQKNGSNGHARYLLGAALLASGEPVAATVELSKARELNFDDAKVAPALARALLEQGQMRKVIEEFDGLRFEDRSATADLKTTVAKAHAVQGDKERALQALDQAEQAVPSYPASLMVKARLKAADKDVDGALALVEQVLAKEAGHEEALMFKGELLAYGKRDWAGALVAWRAAAEKKPNLLPAHAAILRTLIEQNDLDGANKQLAELKKAHPNHIETKFFEAQLAYMAGDYKGTRELTDLVMKVRPDDPFVLQLSGLAEFRMQQFVPAENFLARALKIQPNLGLARQTLAMVYLRTNQPNKAIDLLLPLVTAPNPDGRMLALAAEANRMAGNRKRADELYAMAAKADPKNARVRAAVALNEVTKGNDKGFAELESIAAADPGVRTDVSLIAARLSKRDLDGALKAIDALQKKQPDKPLAYMLRGRVQLLKKDEAGAVASFEKALALDSKYFPAAASLAALDLRHGKAESAKKRFEDQIAADPKNVRAVLALAEVKQRTGAPKAEVLQHLREAVKIAPSEPAPRITLVNYLLGIGDRKAALLAAQDASAALPNNLEVMDVLGVAQVVSGNPEQAVATYKKLGALQPTRALPQLRLADAQLAAGDREGARLAFKRALEIEPGLLNAQRGLLNLAITDRRWSDAATIARETQKLRPTEAVGYVFEGDTEAARKNWDAALASYRTAQAKAPSTDVATKLHRSLVEPGKTAEADRFATTWIAEHPKDALFVFHLGDVATAKRQYAEAEARYREVIKILPDYALAHNNVAWLMVKQSKPGALVFAEKANALMPDRAPILDTLAMALLVEGQPGRALQVQKHAVELAPDTPSLRLTLARIYLQSGDKQQARDELSRLAKMGDKFSQQAEVAELMKTI